jgi:hypothetical protein
MSGITKSKVDIAVTMSATRHPFMIAGNADKFEKFGERIFTL